MRFMSGADPRSPACRVPEGTGLSREHHDNFVGNVTSLWLGSAVLMGFILTCARFKPRGASQDPADPADPGRGVTHRPCLDMGRACKRPGKSRNTPAAREIEKLLGMRQHTDVSDKKAGLGSSAHGVAELGLSPTNDPLPCGLADAVHRRRRPLAGARMGRPATRPGSADQPPNQPRRRRHEVAA